MSKIKSFFSDMKIEMNKVEWPSRAKVSKMTAVVLVVVVVLTTCTFIIDQVLGGLLFH